jgi:integrative and conjugative element protein (TIGR02256 family)
MLEEADDKSPNETGGMMLGYVSPGGSALAVTDIIGPGPNALHRRSRFEPDGAWQQARLVERYAASGRITTYLGDWHSHPGGGPRPSREDVRTARRVARETDSRSRHPLCGILGVSAETNWVLAVYRYSARRLRPVELELGERD